MTPQIVYSWYVCTIYREDIIEYYQLSNVLGQYSMYAAFCKEGMQPYRSVNIRGEYLVINIQRFYLICWQHNMVQGPDLISLKVITFSQMRRNILQLVIAKWPETGVPLIQGCQACKAGINLLLFLQCLSSKMGYRADLS